MKITRRCPFSGDVNVLEIDVTEAQLEDWRKGTLIQNAMPHLSAGEREFLMTGITPKEWEETFNK